ncbi:4-hydroxy-tetrahydrodipicolinate synthase [Balneola vulgaris]|uniref:4-hydroxy-tetrahydrodipicolinate synthase n=1 Tax=Balneola vulgaris TaxID=287535 RepID=UPI0003722013|nr:4-hydroxy-tetrahydrodipicolinate synthase [Balneola vulgaris]
MNHPEFPLYTAMITPFLENGKVDYESFEYLLRKQEQAKNGTLILGSTGEGLNLSSHEKKEIIKFTRLLDLDVPLMVGIGGHDIEEQKALIQYADEVGVDSFLLVTPLYAKPGKEGQFEWFKTLLATTKTPCMLYNVPSRTGVKLHPEVPARLAEEFDHILGIKEASGSVEDFKAFRDHAPSLDLYSGDDGLTEAFINEGGVGLVSVASNVWPKHTHKMVALMLEGNVEALFSDWEESADALFSASNPVPTKVLAQHKGWIKNITVRLPLSVKDLTAEGEEALLEADRKINVWYNA